MSRLAGIAGILLCLAGSAAARAEEGFRLVESTAASVNGEVVFISDVERETCFYRCGAFPGDDPVAMTAAQARDKLVADTLVLQEQKKLGLGAPDNAALVAGAAETAARLAACADPCARGVDAAAARDYAARRLTVREFLARRIAVFVEVSDDDVAAEFRRRGAPGNAAPDEKEREKVRQELFRAKAAREIGNWFERAASKSRIMLSPMEER